MLDKYLLVAAIVLALMILENVVAVSRPALLWPTGSLSDVVAESYCSAREQGGSDHFRLGAVTGVAAACC